MSPEVGIGRAVCAVDHAFQPFIKSRWVVEALGALLGGFDQRRIDMRHVGRNGDAQDAGSKGPGEVDVGPEIRSTAQQQIHKQPR